MLTKILAMSEDTANEVSKLLFDGVKDAMPHGEKGFLGIVHAGQGPKRRTLFLRSVVPQQPEWVRQGGNGLRFDHAYFGAALDAISREPGKPGLMICHSHYGPISPSREPSGPSRPDLYWEHQLLAGVAQSIGLNRPLVGAVASPNGAFSVREYHSPVAKARPKISEGSGLRIFGPGSIELSRYGKEINYQNPASTDSTVRLWGKSGQGLLGFLTVGVVGLGGLGSPVVEMLSRLGVGSLVMIDFDKLALENFNRSFGALRKDIGKTKARYLTRVAKSSATAVDFDVESEERSVAAPEAAAALADCDIVVSAADSPIARQIVDHLSYSFGIPAIDGGTALIVGADGRISGKCQVSSAGPGQPCFECQGIYSRDEVTNAWEEPRFRDGRGYVRDSDPRFEEPVRAPSVIALNALTAGLVVQRVLKFALRFPPYAERSQQRYYVELGEMRWGPVVQCSSDCPKRSWVALGDSHLLPTGMDPAETSAR